MKSLGSLISQSKTLTYLDLKKKDLNPDSTITLLKAVKDSQSLPTMTSLPQVSDEHYQNEEIISVLAEIITASEKMTNLNLEKETLPAPHMATLLNAFADSKSFAEKKHLPEINSELMKDDTVVGALAKLITQSKHLERLKLDKNLSPASAVTLIKALNESDSKENFTKKPDANKEGQNFGFYSKGLDVDASLYQHEEVISELAKFIETTVS